MARTISKQKKKKKNSLFSSNSTEDRISQLPDSVIHHILSFLDTKYVVQTSVLSKRWRPLWTSIHTLKFSCKMFRPAKQGSAELRPAKRGSADQFMRFVDNVLINRGYYDVETFQLNCRSFSGETITTHIYTWINAAVRRNVRRLYIEVVLDPNFRVPASLFTCTSLKNLEFIDSSMGQFSKLVLPTSVNLPNLKYLKLKRLLIVENLSSKFFSNCPALKELILKNCHVEDSDMNFNISCPNLLRLQIDNLHIPKESRVKNLKLYAPKLVFFTCIDHVAIEYDLGSLDHLKSADVTLSNKNLLPKNIYAQRIMNFLRMVHNVKDLKLSAWFLEGMMGNPEIMEDTPIQFCNLRCLVLETFLSNDSFHALTYLLKISPNIESLSLSVINRTEPEAPQSPYVDEVTLPCILDHLKVVEITELCGSVNELKLLEMLLRNSVVLEKVIISCSDSFTMKCEKKFIETLPTFPRPFGAATTMILFKP